MPTAEPTEPADHGASSAPAAERRERPTIRDVAALAGVGIKTVSRVFNDVPTVAPELVERVRSAADKLGYRPNLTAASLRRAGRRSNTVGLLIEDVRNPFSSAVHRAVEVYFRAHGSLVLAGSRDEDPARERELTRTLVDRQVDGLILMPCGDDHRYLVAEQQAGTSVVFIDRLPTPLLGDAVVIDNHGAAREAVRHLLAPGRERIAYFGDGQDVYTAGERFRGYREELAAAGVELDPKLVRHGLRTVEQAQLAARELLGTGNPPQAVFTSQNLVTIGVIEVLHQLGLQHEVALVGFDDIPLAGLLRPGVTVMAQDPAEIGRLAAERLFARMNGDASPPRIYTVPTQLIERGSGELPVLTP